MGLVAGLETFFLVGFLIGFLVGFLVGCLEGFLDEDVSFSSFFNCFVRATIFDFRFLFRWVKKTISFLFKSTILAVGTDDADDVVGAKVLDTAD